MGKSKAKKRISRQTKDVMAVIFLFSLILGIMFTTFLANQTIGQNAQATQAAESQY